MKYFSDLHTHTTASDGQYSPKALVEKAKAAGVECLAVTDHDTEEGAEEALAAGEALGLLVLRGIELGAKEHRYLHILGYGFQPHRGELSSLCEKLRKSRDERKYRILAFLQEKGVPVALEAVEAMAGGNVIARPHFARAMVEAGYVKTTREAFDRYLDTEEYQRLERFKAGAKECIAAIHSAGGKAVLAHPYQLGLPAEELEQAVAGLKKAGLDGLECYYPRHTGEQTDFYLGLAKKYRLGVTGGSDFHGERVKPEIALAAWPLELDWLLA